jgi:hypothetical protein
MVHRHPSSMAARPAPVRHISSPSDLAHLATRSTEAAPKNVHIHFLAPLAETDTFAQCCEDFEDYIDAGVSYRTYLRISSVCDHWRAAWALFPTASLERVVFDVSLPGEMYFRTKVPVNVGVVVKDMDVVRLVTTMATTMSLRSGRNVVFEMTGDGTNIWDPFKELRRILQRLSKPQDAVDVA